MSHDLKTPISSMQETTAALLDGVSGPLTPSQRRLLQHSQESGRRLSSMVGKLLELSRLETRRPPELHMVDVAELARMAVNRFSGSTRHAPIVTLAAPEYPVIVRADAEGLQRVLDNLLENACKFSPADGLIQVTVQPSPDDSGSVLMTVADQGEGILDADKERVFDRFYQTDAGRAARSRGVGLGLSICKHIVTEHGGRISVSDNVPSGAVVSFVLPRVCEFATTSERRR
jgi:signal transduction histidine kinase